MYDIFNKQLKFIRNLISNFLSDASIDPESQNRCLKSISDVKNMQKKGITLVSTLNDRKVIFCHLPMAAILDLCKLQNLPKVATPATKLNILHGPIQVWNHHKTIHFSWQQGPWIGNWTITHCHSHTSTRLMAVPRNSTKALMNHWTLWVAVDVIIYPCNKLSNGLVEFFQ